MAIPSGRARVGWGSTLGNAMRLVLNLTPSTLGSPITDMTTIASVSLSVVRGDGQTVETWTTVAVGTATTTLATFAHTFQPTDLTQVETLTVTALLTTTGGAIVPSDPFQIFVEL